MRLDLLAPPLGFGEVQYADIAPWSGGGDPLEISFLSSKRSCASSRCPQRLSQRAFEAPGSKLQGVTMQDVNIHVGKRDRDEDEEEDEASVVAHKPHRELASFHPPCSSPARSA